MTWYLLQGTGVWLIPAISVTAGIFFAFRLLTRRFVTREKVAPGLLRARVFCFRPWTSMVANRSFGGRSLLDRWRYRRFP